MANSYDEVLYVGHPFPQTHPDRLATIARLFGIEAAPVESCRVLELGCGDGGNLIPMAYTLPGASFVGIDAGARGIEIGQAAALDLGLGNLELRHLDILDTGAELGTFDYIVAHGVYAWVPAEVQERILDICHRNLNPQGVAYISYNAYPGAHIKRMIAEMLQYHARRYAGAEQQIEQARAMLGLLTAARSVDDDPYTWLLRAEVETLAARRPQSLYHDELAECQTPVSFREFVTRAGRHSLQYLGESDFHEMQETSQPAEVSAVLRKLAPDLIDREQYLDFLKCRRFRQTLLCHAAVPLQRRLESAQMREFQVRAAASRKDQAKMPTDHPVALAAKAAVNTAWPAALAFADLLASVRASGAGEDGDEMLLADVVLACAACGAFRLHTRGPQFAAQVSARPRASALARWQASRGASVTNLCHEPLRLEDDLSRRLLVALDGTRDQPALLEALGQTAAAAGDLARSLEGLARFALLEA